MYNDTNELEVNLKDILINIFIKWRYIVIISVILATGLGMRQAVKYINVSQEEYNEEKLKYESELIAYQTTLEMNKKTIEYKTQDLYNQIEYNANSIKMNLDPINLSVGVMKLYIKSDYMILPELSYQNIDISDRVVSAYYSYILDGSFYQKLKSILGEEVPLDYLKEIVQVTENIDKRVISIKIIHKDEVHCNEVIDAIWMLLQEKKDEMINSIGEHEIYKYDEALYTDVDYVLKDYQQSNIQRVKDLNEELKRLQVEQINFKTQGTPLFIYEKNVMIKNGIIKVGIGFVIGFILACMYFGVIEFYSGKLKSIGDFKDRFGIDVICTVNKKRKLKFDCWMLQKLGRIQCDTSEEDNLALIYAIVRKIVLSKEKTQKQPVLIVGSSINDNYKEYSERIQAYSKSLDITFIDGMNLMKNAELLKTISQYQHVLLLEQFNTSKYMHVEEEINLLKKFNIEVLGVVIFDV